MASRGKYLPRNARTPEGIEDEARMTQRDEMPNSPESQKTREHRYPGVEKEIQFGRKHRKRQRVPYPTIRRSLERPLGFMRIKPHAATEGGGGVKGAVRKEPDSASGAPMKGGKKFGCGQMVSSRGKRKPSTRSFIQGQV